ncbi:MAG: hypothetical protein K2I91_01130 [Muribaculaceae bacterium]|nr:hypothetical protein [Muribaculaceae bacterium]
MAEIKTLGAEGIKTLAQIMARHDAATLETARQEIAEIKNNVKAEIIGGASEDYDTLKEIADYIEQHGDVTEALNAAIGNKADKTTVEALDTRVSAIEDADYLTASDIAVFTDAEIEALVAEALTEAE